MSMLCRCVDIGLDWCLSGAEELVWKVHWDRRDSDAGMIYLLGYSFLPENMQDFKSNLSLIHKKKPPSQP